MHWGKSLEIQRKLKRAAKHASHGDAKHILRLAKSAVKKNRSLNIIRENGCWVDAVVREMRNEN